MRIRQILPICLLNHRTQGTWPAFFIFVFPLGILFEYCMCTVPVYGECTTYVSVYVYLVCVRCVWIFFFKSKSLYFACACACLCTECVLNKAIVWYRFYWNFLHNLNIIIALTWMFPCERIRTNIDGWSFV